MIKKIADITIAPETGFKGPGEGLLSNPGEQSGVILNKIISAAIGIMTIVAFIWFLIIIITSAYNYMASTGDKNKIESARTGIINGIIGIMITISAIFIVQIISGILGIESILNPAQALEEILKNLGL